MNLKENRVTKVKNNLGFKEWMQQESGTTSSSIATFAMPLGAIVRRKFPNEKKKKNKTLLEYYQHFDSNNVIKLIRSNIISLNANPSTKIKNALIKNLMKLIHSNLKLHNKFLISNNQDFYLLDILEKFIKYTNKINARELSNKELFRKISSYLSVIKRDQIRDNMKKQKKISVSGADEEHGPGSYSINQTSQHPLYPYFATINPRLQIRNHIDSNQEDGELSDSNEAMALRFLTKLLKNYSKLYPLFGMVFCLLYNIDYENISFNSIRNMKKLKTTAGNGVYRQIFINISKDPKKLKIYSDYLKSLNYKISDLNLRAVETQLSSIANKAKKNIKAAIKNNYLYENSILLKKVIYKIGK